MARTPPPADFYQPYQYGPSESVGYMLRRLTMSMKQEIDLRLEPHGLTNAQWEPLFKLKMCHASTVAEMARELQIDPGATTRLLDRMEAKRLCKRVRSTEDRRVINLELTPEGNKAAAKIPGALAEVMNAHLAGFTKTEWKTLVGYLQRMSANAEALRESREGENDE